MLINKNVRNSWKFVFSLVVTHREKERHTHIEKERDKEMLTLFIRLDVKTEAALRMQNKKNLSIYINSEWVKKQNS